VSDHHGTISVTSDEGHGTTFRIELPQRQAGYQPASAKGASDSTPPPSAAAAAASD
jgi:hypothetical protein